MLVVVRVTLTARSTRVAFSMRLTIRFRKSAKHSTSNSKDNSMSKAGRKFLAEAMETIRENLGLSPCPECTAGDHVMCRQPDGQACCCPVVTFDNVDSEKRGATKSP